MKKLFGRTHILALWSHSADCRKSTSRMKPLELLYASVLQWSGWNSADVITSEGKKTSFTKIFVNEYNYRKIWKVAFIIVIGEIRVTFLSYISFLYYWLGIGYINKWDIVKELRLMPSFLNEKGMWEYFIMLS